jgi:hypothetical protein
MHGACPSHPPWFDHPNNIGKEYKLWSSATHLQISPASCPQTPSTYSVRSSISVRNQISQNR